MATAEKVKAGGYDTSDVKLALTSDEAILVRTMVGHLSCTGQVMSKLADNVYTALGNAGVGLLPEEVFSRNSNGRHTPYIFGPIVADFHKYPGFHV